MPYCQAPSPGWYGLVCTDTAEFSMFSTFICTTMHCKNGLFRTFLSDRFKKFQKICDSICPGGSWFLGVNLGSTTILQFYSSVGCYCSRLFKVITNFFNSYDIYAGTTTGNSKKILCSCSYFIDMA